MHHIQRTKSIASRFTRIVLLSLCVSPNFVLGKNVISYNFTLSSPENITALKNSAVWLHWNYSISSTLFLQLKQDVRIYSVIENKTTVVAEKFGTQQFKLATGLSSDTAKRVTVIGHNNTVKFTGLQYNDSLKRFGSVAQFKIGSSVGQGFPFALKPMVKITVLGAPEYHSIQPSYLEVSENENLLVSLRFDGNPKPTAELQWSHSNKKIPMKVTEKYPFIYQASYLFKKVSSKLCGKMFHIRVRNSIGMGNVVSSTVKVLFNFTEPNLQAGKLNETCVEVRWSKKEVGACHVLYNVQLKTDDSIVFYEEDFVHVSRVLICQIPSNISIANVQLTIKANKRSTSFTAPVSKYSLASSTTVMPTRKNDPKNASKGFQRSFHIIYAVLLIVLLATITILAVWVLRLRKKKNTGEIIQMSVLEKSLEKEPAPEMESNYMELSAHRCDYEPMYSTLYTLTKAAEKKAKVADTQYVNVNVTK